MKTDWLTGKQKNRICKKNSNISKMVTPFWSPLFIFSILFDMWEKNLKWTRRQHMKKTTIDVCDYCAGERTITNKWRFFSSINEHIYYIFIQFYLLFFGPFRQNVSAFYYKYSINCAMLERVYFANRRISMQTKS